MEEAGNVLKIIVFCEIFAKDFAHAMIRVVLRL
jgi:hypothetical protein